MNSLIEAQLKTLKELTGHGYNHLFAIKYKEFKETLAKEADDLNRAYYIEGSISGTKYLTKVELLANYLTKLPFEEAM